MKSHALETSYSVHLPWFTAVYFSLAILFQELILSVSTHARSVSAIFLFLFSASVGSLLSIAVLLFKNAKARTAVGSAILILTGLIYTLETCLFRSLGYFYPIETIIGMGGAVLGSYGGTILQTAVSSLPFILIYQLPTVIYCLVSPKIKGKTPRIKTACLLTACALILNTVSVCSLEDHGGKEYLSAEGYDFNEAIKSLGLGAAVKQNIKQRFTTETSLLSVEGAINSGVTDDTVSYNVSSRVQETLDKNDLTKEILALNRFVSCREPSRKNEKSGLFKGKNIIFICAEALSPYAVSEELTPNLYKITSEGFYFSNYYAPTFGESTSGGEYALLLSQIPKRASGEKGLSMQLAARNDLSYSLPAFFRSNGYFCNGYHNNSHTYYKRNATHPALGLNWYGCGGCVTLDEDAERLDLAPLLSGGWPRSDKELIDVTASGFIDESYEKSAPFFTYYLTVSGHNNYSFTGNAMSKKNREYTENMAYSETVKAYLSAQKELDLAVGLLLEKLEDANILNDTVIVIANDHHPYGLSPTWAGNDGRDYLSELYGKKLIGKTEIEKGFFAIYCHGFANEEIDVPTSSFDVLPTVLNLFGIEYDSRIFCGKDAFSPGERTVFFSDGSFITDKLVFDKARNGTKEDGEYVKKTAQTIRALTQYSVAARRNDYYSYFVK